MADPIAATRAYQAAALIKEAAQNIQLSAPTPLSEPTHFHGSTFGDFLKTDLQKTRHSVERSEELVKANLMGDIVDPVGSAMAVQEATFRVEQTAEALQRLVRAYDEITKIAI